MVERTSRALESATPASSRISGGWNNGAADRLLPAAVPEARRQGVEHQGTGYFLRLAFMATLKGESAFAADEAAAQVEEQMERVQQKILEGRARSEKPLPKLDEEAEAILRHFQTTPYRTKDQDRPE
jgi:hypothetical protein